MLIRPFRSSPAQSVVSFFSTFFRYSLCRRRHHHHHRPVVIIATNYTRKYNISFKIDPHQKKIFFSIKLALWHRIFVRAPNAERHFVVAFGFLFLSFCSFLAPSNQFFSLLFCRISLFTLSTRAVFFFLLFSFFLLFFSCLSLDSSVKSFNTNSKSKWKDVKQGVWQLNNNRTNTIQIVVVALYRRRRRWRRHHRTVKTNKTKTENPNVNINIFRNWLKLNSITSVSFRQLVGLSLDWSWFGIGFCVCSLFDVCSSRNNDEAIELKMKLMIEPAIRLAERADRRGIENRISMPRTK